MTRSKNKPTYDELEKRVEKLEQEVGSKKKAFDKLCHWNDQVTRDFESYKTALDMLELYLDKDWRIIGHSNSLALLTENIIGLRKREEHVRSFLKEGDFEKIQEYLDKLITIKNLPFGQGKKWKLRYRGPSDSEKIGRDWLPFSFSGINRWKIKNGKIIHKPVREKEEDCYLMTATEYGGADEDIKVIFKARTLKNKDLIRDLSLVLSGASGEAGIYPDLVGYTACSGSNGNTEGRIQKKGGNLIVVYEELEPDTEYQITVERTGGKLSREIKNLKTGAQGHLLEVIDTEVVYDRQNYLGLTTYAGEAEFYDLEIYTRKSIFTVDQFRVPFNVEVGINDDKIKDKVFKLRIGKKETGGKTCHMLLFEDITERKQEESARRISKERYEMATRAARVGVWDWNIKAGEFYLDPSVKENLGYKDEEIPNDLEVWVTHVHPDDREPVMKAAQECLEGKTPEYIFEHRMIHKNGTTRWILVRGKVIRDAQGNAVRMVGTDTDITDLKQAEEQIRTSLKEKELLLKEIHHRVKNNLQIISSLLDMSSMRSRDQKTIDLFTEARAKIQTMSLIHTQLYRSERFDRIDMLEYIQELTGYLSNIYLAKKNRIAIVIKCSGVYLSVIQAIPCALVFNELVSNSFRHAFSERQKGVVEILIESPADKRISIRVRDNGTGMPEEIDINKTENLPSLGLKLVYNLVKHQLMGDIRLERKNGTQVFIEFKKIV